MPFEQIEETVLVTGGSGYVAGWMIVGLLKKGFKVRTTLRNASGVDKVAAAVVKHVEIKDRLSFIEADLLRDRNWKEAVSGCKCVFHVASPMGQGQPNADLITPARDGTLRILHAAANNGVEKFVYTSSVVAAQPQNLKNKSTTLTDEKAWTDPDEPSLAVYNRSKTIAEKSAWEFIENDSSGMTLTTILPGMILGRVMTEPVTGSIELIYRLLAGTVPAIPNVGFSIVETESLVDLHLGAMQSPAAANQRFIAGGDFLWMSEIAEVLRKNFDDRAAKVPTKSLPDIVLRLASLFREEARYLAPRLGKRNEFDSSKAASMLSWKSRSAKEAVIYAAESILANRLLQ